MEHDKCGHGEHRGALKQILLAASDNVTSWSRDAVNTTVKDDGERTWSISGRGSSGAARSLEELCGGNGRRTAARSVEERR
jgi:hypothetical protein